MMRLYVVVEGKTEEDFLNTVVGPALAAESVFLKPKRPPHHTASIKPPEGSVRPSTACRQRPASASRASKRPAHASRVGCNGCAHCPSRADSRCAIWDPTWLVSLTPVPTQLPTGCDDRGRSEPSGDV